MTTEDRTTMQADTAPPAVSTGNADALRARDRSHLWHIWSPVTTDMAHSMFVRGAGSYLTDVEGKEYLDASSLNLTCGYAHPGIIGAMAGQSARMHGYDLSVATHDLAGAVAERVASLMPSALSRTLLTNSGTEGCEAALLIAGMYAGLRGEPRTRVVTFESGYHGSTVLTRSLSGLPHLDHPFHNPLRVSRVPLPRPARQTRQPEALGPLLDGMRQALTADPAAPPLAVLVEPLVNVGGGVVLPDGFLTGLRDLCDTHGALLIVDEVSTGYGRTGRLFAFQRENVVPDIVVSSKGLASGYAPIAAVSVRETIYQAFAEDSYLGGLRFGQTTSGHAVACAAALATLDLLEDQKLTERAEQLGGRLLRELGTFLGSADITDVRGLGLFVSVEFAEETTAARVVEAARRHGLLLRRQGQVAMAVPPLTSGESDINLLVERFCAAIEETTR
ncbi:aspartate aminotransferase family protein [Streptomyces mesophilus]|uniref:aminotransferase family protein n=1 Tax=Streptomyces mesophilus TaxID=1775132 RepID=UPI0033202B64